MKATGRQATSVAALLICLTMIAACTPTGGDVVPEDQVFAPGVDPAGEAVSGAEVGARLLAAGEYELALSAYNRAAVERGEIDGEILAGLGAANLGLGRLNQAEDLLRRATLDPTAQPEDWNNLGVLLIETGRTNEAVGVFRKAFALSNGENVAIRDNLRLALEKSENSARVSSQSSSEFKLVRRGNSEFIIRPTP